MYTLYKKSYLFVLFGLYGSFSNIATVSQSDKELNVHFQYAASLKHHAPDTCHDITPSHVILTLGRPVLIPTSTFLMLSDKRKSREQHFNVFWTTRPGMEFTTSRSQSEHSTSWVTVPVVCKEERSMCCFLEFAWRPGHSMFAAGKWSTSFIWRTHLIMTT